MPERPEDDQISNPTIPRGEDPAVQELIEGNTRTLTSSVIRDSRGRVRWGSAKSDPADNLRLTKHNIRALVIDRFPQVQDRFPLNQDGFVPDELRASAEEFIARQAAVDSTLRKQIVASTGSRLYPHPYKHIATSLDFALFVAFEAWGLFNVQRQEFIGRLEQREQRQRTLGKLELPDQLCITNGGAELAVDVLSQRAGLDRMLDFLVGNVGFQDLKPVYLTDIRPKENKRFGKIYGEVHVKRGVPALSFEERVYQEYQKHGVLILVPNQDTQFDYVWFDLYPFNNGAVDFNTELSSIRLNRETGKIEIAGWYGPEKQAFLDYSSGKLALADNVALPVFKGRVYKNGDIYIGRTNNTNIRILFNSPILEPGSEAVIDPNIDRDRGYFWVEGYAPDDIARSGKLFSRRVVQGDDGKVEIIDWKGPEIQSLIDWCHDRLPIGLTKEAAVAFDPKISIPQVFLGAENMLIRLRNNPNFDRNRPAYLVAREKNIYKWIAVEQDDIEGKRVVIRTSLVEKIGGNPTLNSNWPGIERQLILGYLHGRVKSEQLESFIANVASGGFVYVARYHSKDLKLALRSIAFRTLDKVLLSPLIDDDGNLAFNVTKTDDPDTILARAKFDKNTNSFKTSSFESALSQSRKPMGHWTLDRIAELATRVVETHGDLTIELAHEQFPGISAQVSSKYPGGWIGLRRDLGLVQADQSGTFTDKEGKIWGVTSVIARTVGMDLDSAISYLSNSGLTTISGRGYNSRVYSFYDFDAACNFLKSQNIKRHPSTAAELPAETQAEIDEYFNKLLGESE